MFIFTLDYWDNELYIRRAEIKEKTEKEAHEKLRQTVTLTKYIKTITVKEE